MRTIRPLSRNGFVVLPSLVAIVVAVGLTAAPMSLQVSAAEVSEPTTGLSEDAPPVAENVDLSEPVNPSEKPVAETAAEAPGDDVPQPDPPAPDPLADAVAAGLVNRPIVLLDTTVPVATSARLSWSPAQNFEGIAAPMPVLVVNGAKPGPTRGS